MGTLKERVGAAEKLELEVLMRIESRDGWIKESLRAPGVNAICKV